MRPLQLLQEPRTLEKKFKVLGPGSWVLGPLGALLAVPMCLLAGAVFLDTDPDSNWLRPSVANRPDDPPGFEPGRHEADVTGATD